MAAPLAVACEYFDAFNRRDWDALGRVLHEEYSYTGRGGERLEGRAAGVKRSQAFATRFPGLVLRVKSIYVFPEGAVVEFVPALTNEPASRADTPEPWICAVLEMRAGQIHTEREYWQSR